MPIVTCDNAKGPGTWLKSLNAVSTKSSSGVLHVAQSSELSDSDLVWVKNTQQLAYSYKEDFGDHTLLHLNLRGHKKLLAYEPHFPELRLTAKKELDRNWVFYPQTDNLYLAWDFKADNTCNSSSNAMYLEAFRPEAISDDQTYVNRMFYANFASTNHDHQTIMLERHGIKSRWNPHAYWDDLITETDKGNPTVVGFYHRGSRWSPSGGHVGMVIDATKDWVEILDPYGNLLDGYTTDVWNGYRAVYPRAEFEPRWIGNGNGWMREFIDYCEPWEGY